MITDILLASIILGGLGGIFGLGLSFAAKVFYVEVDERVTKVRDVVPGANCGACGYTGCDSFAEAIVNGKAKSNACSVGGDQTAKAIANILGIEQEKVPSISARVLCNGRSSVSLEKYNYTGIDDCAGASSLFGGHKSCAYGCIGHGNCVRACPFDAITVADGVAIVIEERCRACQKCVSACPKNLIQMLPKDNKHSVMCLSKDKGTVTKINCQVGCIGCKKCIKVCPVDAITIDNFLASIDPDKCNNCGECAKVCPTMAIR